MPVEFIERWWLTCFIVFAVAMYVFAFAGYRVQEDAKKRGFGKTAVTFWSVGVVFFGPIFLPLYLLFRSRAVFAGSQADAPTPTRYILCPHCGAGNAEGERICGKCHRALEYIVSQVGRKACPYCAADNPIEAQRCVSCDQVIGFIEGGADEE